MTFGRAAKVLAIYLKSAIVLGPGVGTAFARVAHPPIDGILLRNLASSDVKSEHQRRWAKTKWTRLNHEQYYELIGQNFAKSSIPRNRSGGWSDSGR